MNSCVVIAFFACLAAANAGLYHGLPTRVLAGSRTTLVGPSSSVVSRSALGGHLFHEERPGFIARFAPLLAPALTYSAPITTYSTGLSYPSTYDDSTIVAGPSGTIATRKAAHAVYDRPTLAYTAPVLPYGAIHEGQDISKLFYDDGSYKSQVYHY